MDEKVIQIENLVKYYDGRCVLYGINLKVPEGYLRSAGTQRGRQDNDYQDSIGNRIGDSGTDLPFRY